MNKQIVLVSTFCNTEEKIEILRKNIVKIKNKGIDVALITPLILPADIIESSDYVFFTKENPILDWPVHSMYNWRFLTFDDKKVKISETYPDYGWSGLNHVKRLGEMFLNYPYETYAYIIYDTILNDGHLDMIRNGHDAIVFPSKRGGDIWKVGLHLMIFNKEMLGRLVKKITLRDYLSYSDYDAFAYLHNHLVKPMQIEIAKEPVEDEIFYYENVDVLNHSTDENIKYFISSPDEYVEEVRLLFYNIKESFDLKISINGNQHSYTISNGFIIPLGLLKKDVESIIIEYNNIVRDITEKIKSIKNSELIEIKE